MIYLHVGLHSLEPKYAAAESHPVLLSSERAHQEFSPKEQSALYIKIQTLPKFKYQHNLQRNKKNLTKIDLPF